MADAIYSVVTSADVATGTSAKSILGARSGSAFGIQLTEASIAFAGTSSTAVPILVELCYATFATNAPGTNSTSETPAQVSGRVITHGTTAARNWTTQPTALTSLKVMLIHAQAGMVYQIPLGQEPDSAVSEGFTIRVTAAADVNCRATLSWRRC